MPTAIQLTVDGNALTAELNDSETSTALLQQLPLTVTMSRWGEEYYGDIGDALSVSEAADARDEMAIGELAYWLPGNALCIFFGPTPASEGDEPRAASPVNPIGRITDSVAVLKGLGGTVRVRVETVA